jgi:hypothetical protein
VRVRTVSTVLVSGAAVAGLAIAGAAGAAPAGNGATVVASQNGVATHRLCASQDVYLDASGFAPNRRVVQASIQIVGSGFLFNAPIKLTNGAGSVDTGTPGPDFIGAKARVRFQTGSSGNVANKGSWSATIVDC